MSRPQPSAAGIVAKDGERVVAATRRADGSLRKEIRIRPGYVPPEDVARYANQKVEGMKLPEGYVVGLGVVDKNKAGHAPGEAEKSKAAKKNEKRRAKKKKGGEGGDEEGDQADGQTEPPVAATSAAGAAPADPAAAEATPADDQKHLRNLKKKLQQAKDLEAKKAAGDALLPEQEAKVSRLPELEDEVAALEAKLAGIKV
ncbi:hypothetical protein DFJ74DRAFT_702834 [Hyaloraphidium curvatum]|nr:hypothetical protein DFJ74DRAFT_702834 [Hyaloraphidium curvatum]